MVPMASSLQHLEQKYADLSEIFTEHQFALGGLWEYDHGSFDRYLDEEHKVWLRIPFHVTHGELDGDPDCDAVIELDKPFVLKHLYNEGLDQEAAPKVAGSLVDQFQEPVDRDAEIEEKWVREAADLLKRVEAGLLH